MGGITTKHPSAMEGVPIKPLHLQCPITKSYRRPDSFIPWFQAVGNEDERYSSTKKFRSLCTGLEHLRARSADTEQHAEIIEQLADRGVDFQTVAAQVGKLNADPFDLLCHLVFNAPVFTRRQRADRVKKRETAFFNYFCPEVREILNDLLDKHAVDGEIRFTLPDALKFAPIGRHRNVAEICRKFGSTDQLRSDVHKLQSLLYAAKKI